MFVSVQEATFKVKNELYTVEEVAEMLRVTEATIREWLKDSSLKGTKIGRRWYVSGSELESRLRGYSGETALGRRRIRDHIVGLAHLQAQKSTLEIEVGDWESTVDSTLSSYLPVRIGNRVEVLPFTMEVVTDAGASNQGAEYARKVAKEYVDRCLQRAIQA